MHDRRDRLAEDQDLVECLGQALDRRSVHFYEEAILAADPMALADVRQLRRQRDDLGELSGARANSDPGNDGESERGGVDVEAISTDDADEIRFRYGDCANAGRRSRLLATASESLTKSAASFLRTILTIRKPGVLRGDGNPEGNEFWVS
jgi:hypothetical protein